MAKQIGTHKFSGKLDDVCGRQTKDGAILQRVPGPTSEQVKTHQRFTNTRRNASEFKGAVNAATLLRRVLGSMERALKHADLVPYMNQKLQAVAMSDTVSGWGDRRVHKGDIHLLEGFDYHPKNKLAAVLPLKLEHSLDVTTGQMQLTAAGGMVRRKRNAFPKEATHFRIVSCAGAVNFEKEKYTYHIEESELLPLSKVMSDIHLAHALTTARPGDVMLHTVGMVLYAVNDKGAHLLRGGAMQIVAVAGVEAVVAVQPASVAGSDTVSSTGVVGRHTCASACVEEGIPMVRAVVVKRMVCTPCAVVENVRGIALTESEVETGVAINQRTEIPGVMNYEAGITATGVTDEVIRGNGGVVVGDDIPIGADHTLPVEIDPFEVGVTDAMGVPLKGASAVGEKEMMNNRPGKRVRLRGYCKDKE